MAEKFLSDVYDGRSLARLLGYEYRKLTYLVFGMRDADKYRRFEISKANGGKRPITAPIEKLALLQRKIADQLLKHLRNKIDDEKLFPASHGFLPNRSIQSNAKLHCRKKFVLNIDISNFFGSIPFHRIRGVLIHDSKFQLPPTVATFIARAVTHQGILPQGAPSSPLLSNIYCSELDRRLYSIARRSHCTYSRYADDISFSGNDLNTLKSLLENADEVIGSGLPPKISSLITNELSAFGFDLNERKTRVRFSHEQQTATGLVVNRHPNAPRRYRRLTRAMAHTYAMNKPVLVPSRARVRSHLPHATKVLHGRLSYLQWLEDSKPNVSAEKNIQSKWKTDLGKFLLAREFRAPDLPVLIGEGPTDMHYLRVAIRADPSKTLLRPSDHSVGLPGQHIKFFNYSGKTSKHLRLGDGGIPSMKVFLDALLAYNKKHGNFTNSNPVIFLVDNDDEGIRFFRDFNTRSKPHLGALSEYCVRLGMHLYLLRIDCIESKGFTTPRIIEDLFDAAVLDVKLSGRTFTSSNKFDPSNYYGKMELFREVIEPNIHSINFARFYALLECICDVVESH